MAMSKERKAEIAAALRMRAHALRITLEEAASDQIADLKTSARDSILRGTAFGIVIGVALGAWLFT